MAEGFGNGPATLPESTMDDDKISGGLDNVYPKHGSPNARPSTSSSYSSDEDTLSSSMDMGLKFDNLNHWICCICIVTFDLELGQAIEVLYKHVQQHLLVVFLLHPPIEYLSSII